MATCRARASPCRCPPNRCCKVSEINVHGTAIVIGTRGMIFLGASGSGKSTLAFACLASAKRCGLFAALVSDDQVLVSLHGNRVVARAPAAIAGLIELRGSGIATIETVSPALLHHAILPVRLSEAERLPPGGETIELASGMMLPAMRLALGSPDPLAVLLALLPVNGKP